MSRVLVIGCGGVASVAIQKCCQVDEVFTEMCIASRTKEKCDLIEYRVDIVCRAGADDQNKFIRCAGKDVADFRVTFFLDFYDPVRERVHFFHFRRNRKLFYKIHSHCTVPL